jgi:hypothetical protein
VAVGVRLCRQLAQHTIALHAQGHLLLHLELGAQQCDGREPGAKRDRGQRTGLVAAHRFAGNLGGQAGHRPHTNIFGQHAQNIIAGRRSIILTHGNHLASMQKPGTSCQKDPG